MAFFELNSDITIGDFRFSGVHEVTITRGIHGISEKAMITLPSKTSIIKTDRTIETEVTTGEKFKEGMPVEIRLGYNGELRTEFRGFVKKRNLDKPLVVECEGYSFRLRSFTLNMFATDVTVGDLLKPAVKNLPGDAKITVVSDTAVKLEGYRIPNLNIASLVTNLIEATDGNLTCFFIEPDVLWCGTPYTSIANGKDPFRLGEVTYGMGYNTISNIELKLHEGGERLEVSYSKKVGGKKKTYVSDAYKDTTKKYPKLLNIPSESSLKILANEKAYSTGYIGYEGKIETFLQPYAAPGFIADVWSDMHKEQNGKYLVTGTEVKFGAAGARRTVWLGPKLGFQNTKQ